MTRIRIAIIEVSAEGQGTNLVLTITDPRGKRLETLDNAEILRHHFSAWDAGNYQMCVQN